MARVEMRDLSPGGHQLSGATVEGLPDRASIREILTTRIRAEVAAYNEDPGRLYRGLVQPEDAVRYSDGFRMPNPRPLDAERLLTATEEAVRAGVVIFHVGDLAVDDLEHEVDLNEHQQLTTVLRRPIVARTEG